VSKPILTVAMFFLSLSCICQDIEFLKEKGNKGKAFFYWGWNRDHFSKSNIHFSGEGYDFTLKKVIAHDKPSEYSSKEYINPADVTIPQYNYRVGYYLTDKYSLSFGFDHMKYVMTQDQIVDIEGTISNSYTAFDGTYNNDPIVLSENFLMLEHTDGLNYLNLELRKNEKIYRYRKFSLDILGGVGVGMMVPRTDATLLGKRRHDEFHIAGYGLDALVGATLHLGKTLFIQTELKVGYTNMANIRTTYSSNDKASQSFFFSQQIFVLGAQFGLYN